MKGPFTDIYTDEHIFAPESQLSAAMLNSLAIRHSDEFWRDTRTKPRRIKSKELRTDQHLLLIDFENTVVQCMAATAIDADKSFSVVRYFDRAQTAIGYFATDGQFARFEKVNTMKPVFADFQSEAKSSRVHRFEIGTVDGKSYLFWSQDNASQVFDGDEVRRFKSSQPDMWLAVENVSSPGIATKVIQAAELDSINLKSEAIRFRYWDNIYKFGSQSNGGEESKKPKALSLKIEESMKTIHGPSFQLSFDSEFSPEKLDLHYWVFPEKAGVYRRLCRTDLVWTGKVTGGASPDDSSDSVPGSGESASEDSGEATAITPVPAALPPINFTPPTSAPKPVQQWFASIDLDEIFGLGPEDVMEMIKDAFGNPKIRTKGWMEAITEVLNQRDAEDVNIS